jgi:hypothetical protein
MNRDFTPRDIAVLLRQKIRDDLGSASEMHGEEHNPYFVMTMYEQQFRVYVTPDHQDPPDNVYDNWQDPMYDKPDDTPSLQDCGFCGHYPEEHVKGIETDDCEACNLVGNPAHTYQDS